jgi:hypothetical protein
MSSYFERPLICCAGRHPLRVDYPIHAEHLDGCCGANRGRAVDWAASPDVPCDWHPDCITAKCVRSLFEN